MLVHDDDGEALEATATLERGPDGFDVVIASRSGRRDGPTARNPDYERLVQTLLERAGTLGATLLGAQVVSDDTAALPLEDRLLRMDGLDYPVALATIGDFEDLRIRLCRPQGAIGRRPGASGPGNRNKKIRLRFGLDPKRNGRNLEALLGGDQGRRDPVPRTPDMYLVAYGLARLGQPQVDGRRDAPPAWLGASEWGDTYRLFFPVLGQGRAERSFANSLKNARDSFDPYVASNRRGWLQKDGTPAPPTGMVQRILEQWRSRSDEDLQAAVMAVLQSPPRGAAGAQDTWAAARRRIELTTRQTVAASGKTQQRVLKDKELRCADLEKTLDELAHRQGFRCAQTDVVFDEGDPDLRASLDRIDSDGHYEDGSLPDGVHNLQLVTHWYNMAKSTRSDADMNRLLHIHAAAALQRPAR
jgi:hypothetical protein